jgi:hypothetical protein
VAAVVAVLALGCAGDDAPRAQPAGAVVTAPQLPPQLPPQLTQPPQAGSLTPLCCAAAAPPVVATPPAAAAPAPVAATAAPARRN